MSTNLRVLFSGLFALSLSANLQSAVADQPIVQQFGSWKVTIQPSSKYAAPAASVVPPAPGIDASTPATGDMAASPAAVPGGRSVNPAALAQLYPQVYNAIPFSRPEYEANPSYRHDAAMEFLFGQMRQTVIQRGTSVINQNSTQSTTPGWNINNMPNAYSRYGFNSYYYPFMWGYNQ
jgi:hypothetical protein